MGSDRITNLFRESCIHRLYWLGGESTYKTIDGVLLVNKIRRLLMLMQLMRFKQVAKNAIVFHLALHQTVAEAESGSGKSISDRRINVGVILSTKARVARLQVKIIYIFHAQNDGQPFIVTDVLHFSHHNPTSLLIDSFVVPM